MVDSTDRVPPSGQPCRAGPRPRLRAARRRRRPRRRGLASDRATGARLRAEAYQYGIAVLDMDRTFHTQTSPTDEDGFWSLTMYDAQTFFVPTPDRRYLVNGLTGLKRNADGSVDVYLQRTPPAKAAQRRNWLPTPAAGFRLIDRLYRAKPSAFKGSLDGSGWDPPAVPPCGAGKTTSVGVACAR